MKTVLAYPGNMAHAQHAARAMMNIDSLAAFVTTYVFRADGRMAALLANAPSSAAKRVLRQLARRSIDQLPPQMIHSYPMWEIVRSAAQRGGANPAVVDAIWDRLSHSFDALVARRYVPKVQAVQSFEYTALATFERSKREGIATALHLPSLDSAHYREIERREKREWKELNSPYDAYFDSKFAERQERRLREIGLADVIVTNSSLTARSHIAAGADPAKTFSVGLAAPPPISEIRVDPDRRYGPLRVLSAGPFSLRKGAHYLVRAWQRLRAGPAAVLDIYGRPDVPERVFAGVDGSIRFHGSVPQSTLFEAYENADILVFPTLCDGFGMVVAEAMAHGLPVITTDQAGAADLVTPDNGIVIPAADSDALADALRWCLDNRDKLQDMRPHALQAAKRRQWSDYRRDLVAALDTGFRAKGYRLKFGRPN